ERIAYHCLEKSPEQRFQSASDIAFALEALSGSSDAIPAPPVASSPERGRVGQRGGAVWKGAVLLAGLAALVAVPIAVIHWRELPPQPRLMRFSIELPENTMFPAAAIASIAVSPDGRHVAFIGSSSVGLRLWLQTLDQLTPRLLPVEL